MMGPKTADGSSASEILRDDECLEGYEVLMLRDIHSMGRVGSDGSRGE
jgi:hypothetical protein